MSTAFYRRHFLNIFFSIQEKTSTERQLSYALFRGFAEEQSARQGLLSPTSNVCHMLYSADLPRSNRRDKVKCIKEKIEFWAAISNRARLPSARMNVVYSKLFGGSLEYKGIPYPIAPIWQYFTEDVLNDIQECSCGMCGPHPWLFCPMENCWKCGQLGHWNLVCPHFGVPNTCRLLRYQAVEDLRKLMAKRPSGFDAVLAEKFAARVNAITCDADYENEQLIARVLYLGVEIRWEMMRQALLSFAEVSDDDEPTPRRIRNRRAHARAKARRQHMRI